MGRGVSYIDAIPSPLGVRAPWRVGSGFVRGIECHDVNMRKSTARTILVDTMYYSWTSNVKM